MAKDVQMSIKMEPELRDQFMSIAADHRRPATQIIHELMRFHIADGQTPMRLTAETTRISLHNADVCPPVRLICFNNWTSNIGRCIFRSKPPLIPA